VPRGDLTLVNNLILSLSDDIVVSSSLPFSDRRSVTTLDWAYVPVKSYYDGGVLLLMPTLLVSFSRIVRLQHSGEMAGDVYDEYDDESGMMGYSYRNSDGPLMCFNNAKNWQMNWFTALGAMHVVDEGQVFNGLIKGQVLYDKTASSQDPVVVKINAGSGNDLFVGFNYKALHNSGTMEGGDLVTIQSQGGEGTANGYKSELLAKLNQGQTYQGVLNNMPISVTVYEIGTSTTPDTPVGSARVQISYGKCIAWSTTETSFRL